MPTPELLQKFKKLTSVSKTFNLLRQSEQDSYLAAFGNTEDDQIVEAMKVMEEEDRKYQYAEQSKLAQAQKQVEQSEKLNQRMRETAKEVKQEAEAGDLADSQQILQNIEKQLDKKEEAPEQIKSKKFLGIF